MIDRQRVSDLLEADPYARSLHIELMEVTRESIVLTMEVTEAMTNFQGGMHGGALFSLADCAFSLYSNSYGPSAVAIDTHMVFSAAVRPGDILRAVVEEVHRGRTLATYRVLIRREDGRVAGQFTGTVYIIA
jgi:acyl-CoA thioesterase